MSIVWGAAYAALAILLFAFVFSQTRRRPPRAVFDNDAFASAAALIVTALIAFSAFSFATGLDQALVEFAALPLAAKAALVALPFAALIVAFWTIRAARGPAPGRAGVVLQMPPRGPGNPGRTPPANGARSKLKRAA